MIKNYSQLKNSMERMAKVCLTQSANNIEQIIHSFLQDWYSDYSPAPTELGGYSRTFTFLNDCLKKIFIQKGNKLIAYIYIDKEILKNEYGVSSKYIDEMLYNANTGVHGVYFARNGNNGVRFWEDAKEHIEKYYYEQVLNEFIKFAKSKGLKIGLRF